MLRPLPPLAVCTLLTGCYSVHTFEDSLGGVNPLALGGVRGNAFEVCVDGEDQPHGTLLVENVTYADIALGFATTGFLSTTATDSTLRSKGTVTVRAEMLGPLPKDLTNAGTLSILNVGNNSRLAGPYNGIIAVDVRLIEVAPIEWDEEGVPSIVVVNPTPFPTKVHLASVGSWFTLEKETPLPPKARTTIPLSIAGPAILPEGVAAEITIEGTRCSSVLVGGFRKVRIPSHPSGGLVDPRTSIPH